MKTCFIDGCGRKYRSGGYCGMHYARARRGLDLAAPVRESFGPGCLVAGCDHAHRSKGYCARHYARMLGGRTLADPPPPAKLSPCAADGCDQLQVARGWCKNHYYRWLGHGTIDIIRTKDRPGYAAAHLRVRKAKGPAAQHECVDCDDPAMEWSYDWGDSQHLADRQGRVYSLNVDHYVPRCRSCHRVHDAFESKHRAPIDARETA